MINISQALLYYKRLDVQKALVSHAEDKEISGCFNMQGFSKRPDIFEYSGDVLEMVKRGATSFHCSEELWNNPLNLSSNLTRKQLDNLRKGWDLILDIDCKELEFSKIATHYLMEALKYQGIESVYVKFSGNHGFHIGVPFEAFPKKVHDNDTKELFPEAPRRIAAYLQFLIEPHLRKALLAKYTKEEISKLANKPIEDIMVEGLLQPFTFLDIDTVLISSRHMYRMPYSFNEKSGLVSIPIAEDSILSFTKMQALPQNVKVTNIPFIERNVKPNQATKLFIQAFDYNPNLKHEEKSLKWKFDFEELQETIPELFFPPCIQTILAGLEDGKKRSMFVLINFLSNVGWNKTQVEERIKLWNQSNPEPLKEAYLKGQFKFKNKVLPPNCDNNAYYKDMNICKSDNLCLKIKNPVNYSKRKSFMQSNKTDSKPGRVKLTEEQKKMRREYRQKIEQEKTNNIDRKGQ
ncbi:hypothetical protein J4418_01180 [Candidatus Woesearchaeota archaeon]|nr:hypothetical protein [Candidatus Woesearchaeota archaeon]